MSILIVKIFSVLKYLWWWLVGSRHIVRLCVRLVQTRIANWNKVEVFDWSLTKNSALLRALFAGWVPVFFEDMENSPVERNQTRH